MKALVIDVSRGLGTAAVLLSAVVHLDLYYLQGFRDIATIGPLFLLNGFGGIVLGVVMTSWRHWLPNLAGAGFGALTVLFYWISVVHGLFGLKEQTGGGSEILAEVAEYAAVLFGLIAAAGLFTRPRRHVATTARERLVPPSRVGTR